MAYRWLGAARRSVWVGAVGVLALGCTARGSASFGASSAGDAQLDASGEIDKDTDEGSGEPTVAKRSTKDFRYVDGRLEYSGSIEFEYNRAELRGDEQTQKSASGLLTFLKDHPDVKIRIEGHTDSRGTNRYNKDLSNRRVAALRDWLIGRGVEDSRLTSVGMGEESPKVAEPPECHNKVPADQSVCEGPWAQNRRVEFHVTEGGDALARQQAEEEAPAPEPEPEPVAEAPPEEPKRDCAWVSGLGLSALGPSSLFGVSLSTQPLCWLELGLWVGYDQGEIEAQSANSDIQADYTNFNIMLRGRLWLLERHSPIADLGLGVAIYDFEGTARNDAGERLTYTRDGTPLIASLGIGYGFRADRLRLGLLAGIVVHPTKLGDSSYEADPGVLAEADALSDRLHREGNEFTDLKPYGELFVSWMFF